MKYYFVIDTDTYAGNFERQLCAFITGMIGECGMGDKIAEIARNQLGTHVNIFKAIVGFEPDDHGCTRPVKIYPTPGYYNNGFGFEYVDGEEELAKEAYRKRCLELAESSNYKEEAANLAHKKEWTEKKQIIVR